MLDNFMTNSYSFTSYTNQNEQLLYLDYIRQTSDFQYVNTTPDVAYRYQGNLFGLFSELNINPNLFVLTMYLNGYYNPHDYQGDKVQFKLAIKPPIPIS